MDAKTQARFEARARILKAQTFPIRLCLVNRLYCVELSVAELAEAVGVPEA